MRVYSLFQARPMPWKYNRAAIGCAMEMGGRFDGIGGASISVVAIEILLFSPDEIPGHRLVFPICGSMVELAIIVLTARIRSRLFEICTIWRREHPRLACATGGTGNNG